MAAHVHRVSDQEYEAALRRAKIDILPPWFEPADQMSWIREKVTSQIQSGRSIPTTHFVQITKPKSAIVLVLPMLPANETHIGAMIAREIAAEGGGVRMWTVAEVWISQGQAYERADLDPDRLECVLLIDENPARADDPIQVWCAEVTRSGDDDQALGEWRKQPQRDDTIALLPPAAYGAVGSTS
jgi:hypothetical protein